MATVEQAFEQLKGTPFPDFPEDDAMADWVGELAEFDGYVAGLAMSTSGGVQIDAHQLGEQAQHFRSAFMQLPISYPEHDDNRIYYACERYLRVLDGLVKALIGHKKFKGD